MLLVKVWQCLHIVFFRPSPFSPFFPFLIPGDQNGSTSDLKLVGASTVPQTLSLSSSPHFYSPLLYAGRADQTPMVGVAPTAFFAACFTTASRNFGPCSIDDGVLSVLSMQQISEVKKEISSDVFALHVEVPVHFCTPRCKNHCRTWDVIFCASLSDFNYSQSTRPQIIWFFYLFNFLTYPANTNFSVERHAFVGLFKYILHSIRPLNTL